MKEKKTKAKQMVRKRNDLASSQIHERVITNKSYIKKIKGDLILYKK